MHSGCVEDPTGVQHFTDRQYHTWYGVVSTGSIDYGPDGAKFLRGGLTGNLSFEGDQPGRLMFYMAAQTTSAGEDPGKAAIPDLVLEATLREGAQLSVGNEAYNTGKILAHGSLGPVTIFPGGTAPGVTEHNVDGMTVYGFTLDLAWESLQVSEEESFNLRIDAYVDNPLCMDGEMMPDFLRPHSSHGLRPTLTFGAANAMGLEALHPQFIDKDLVLHVTARSPFGIGDTQVDVVSDVAFQLAAMPTHYHGHGQTPTPVWSYLAHNVTALPDGDYPIEILWSNLQGTMGGNMTATLTVEDGAATLCMIGCIATTSTDKEAPGVPAMAPLGALAAIALLARRR